MVEASLNSIMNEMARAPQKGVVGAFERRKRLRSLSELEAFMCLDGTLDSLHKQYMDAKAQRKELVAMCGGDDAMAAMAIDLEDSCWCAMQTRYIELRAKGKMMARVQSMMRQRERDIEGLELRILKRDQEKQARDFVNYLKIVAIMKEKNKTPRIFEWLAVFLFLKIDVFGQDHHKKSYAFRAAATA